MMPERIEELQQQRAAIVTDQRRILDAAEGENRNLSAEESQEYERMDSEYGDLDVRIARLQDQRERSRSLAEAEAAARGGHRGIGTERDGDPQAGEEQRAYREAFDHYLRVGEARMTSDELAVLRGGYTADAARDMNTGTAAAGGYTVPTTMRNELVVARELAAPMIGLATVLETAGGNTITIPKVTAHGAATWEGEGVAPAEVDETFGEATLDAFAAVKLVKVTLDLLEDSGVNIETYLAGEIGRRVGKLEGTGYATGDGTGKPRGIMLDATVGVTTAGAGVFTSDEVLDLVYSVDRAYRSGPSVGWLVSDDFAKEARKLKDGQGRYIWQEGLQQGEPARLLGYAVNVDPSIDAVATGKHPALFGDLSCYYVRAVQGFRLFRFNERYMDERKVGFLGWHRTDGELVDLNGVRSLAVL